MAGSRGIIVLSSRKGKVMDVWSLVSTLLGVLIAAILILAIALIIVFAVAAITLAIVNARVNEIDKQTTIVYEPEHPSRRLRAVD